MTAPISVYVLRNPGSGRRYTGITANLARRIREHAREETKGGQQLQGEFEVLLVEQYPDYATARAREKFLKSGVARAWLDANLPRAAILVEPAKGG